MRRSPVRLTLAALLLVTLLGAVPAASADDLGKLYFIAIDDNGVSGPFVGCGDSVVAVNAMLPSAPTLEGRITAALQTLFAYPDAFYGMSGLYNALQGNSLSVTDVDIQGTTAAVYLTGSPFSGGTCDDPRIEAQIIYTAKQFPGVTNVVVVLDGGPLFDLRGPDYFPATNHYTYLPFSVYWENNGGLPVFGYPISEQLVEGGYRVQYFERQRMEHHPENPAPYHVLLGLLGVQRADQLGLSGTAPFQRHTASPNPNCEYVLATGHNLCYGFRQYWHNHGLDFGDPGYSYRESLALFGYPISEEFTSGGRTVQYFERARLEWHPENPAPWDVLGGLLGVETWTVGP